MKKYAFIIIAGLLITGCAGTKVKSVDATPQLSEKAVEDYLAKRSESSVGDISREEAEKGNRFLSSTWSVDVDTSTENRAIKSISSSTDIGSSSDLSQLSQASVKVNQDRSLDVGGPDGKPSLLNVPVGIELTIGSVGNASMESVAEQIKALAARDTAKADGVAKIYKTVYEGLALVVDAEGKARVLQINAKSDMYARVINSTGTIIEGVIEGFSPYAAGSKVLEKVLVRDTNTGASVEGTLIGNNPISDKPLTN